MKNTLMGYLHRHRLGILLFFVFSAVFAVTFALYRLPWRAVLYPVLICFFIGACVLIPDLLLTRKKHRLLLRLCRNTEIMLAELPETDGVIEEDYCRIIRKLREERNELEASLGMRYDDMIDYYTLWAHQIKTPIASMRLTLQNEDSPVSRRLSSDLFRVEQYVEMVLAFLRLDAASGDYVIRECDADPVIRQSVRKFAGEFIGKKIRLEYTPVPKMILTDEKWFAFVLEQVLSNALKYTREGGTVWLNWEENETLCVRDSGIGIAPEDLPRVFEKGYTGCNGRTDKRASGIGLYLCRKVCDRLGHGISLSSEPDRGTVVRLRLDHYDLKSE